MRGIAKLGVSLALSLVALGASQAASAQDQLSVVTGPVGGTMYAISAAWADALNQNQSAINITNQAGGGSVVTLSTLVNRDADFALAGNDVALDAFEGTGSFEGNAVTDLRGVATLYLEAFHAVVPADSPIEDFASMEGMRVAVGPPNSGTGLASERLLPVFGLEPGDVNAMELGFQEAADYLRDGNVDATIFQVGFPYAPILDVGVVKPVRVLSMNEDQIADVQEEYPFYVPVTIPGDTYSGMTGPVETVAVKMLLLTREDLSENAVYEATKQLFENLDALASAHQAGTSITLEGATEGMTVPLHAGAERYFREVGAVQ